MPSRQEYVSGDLVPEEDAKMTHTLTESTLTFAHTPFKLDRHIARLYKSLKVTRIDPGCDAEGMKRITLDLLERNLPLIGADDDYWIVHNISRGRMQHGPDPTKQSGAATVMISNSPMDLRGWAPFFSAGCHAVTAMSRMIPSQSLDARVKNRSRMAYTLAEMEVKLVDPDAQGIILDIHGNVGENKGGNVFVVSDGELRTPTSQNSLAGISRETVLELGEVLGIPTRELELQPYDLYTADELFFTSTPYCIMPATRFNGLPVGDGQVGEVTRRLLAAWSERVGVDIAGQAEGQLK